MCCSWLSRRMPAIGAIADTGTDADTAALARVVVVEGKEDDNDDEDNDAAAASAGMVDVGKIEVTERLDEAKSFAGTAGEEVDVDVTVARAEHEAGAGAVVAVVAGLDVSGGHAALEAELVGDCSHCCRLVGSVREDQRQRQRRRGHRSLPAGSAVWMWPFQQGRRDFNEGRRR